MAARGELASRDREAVTSHSSRLTSPAAVPFLTSLLSAAAGTVRQWATVAGVVAISLAAGIGLAGLPMLAPALVASSATALLVLMTLRMVRATRDVRRWSGLSLVIHMALGLVIVAIPRLVAYLGPDAELYHSWAFALADHWRLESPAPALPQGKEGFIYLLGGLYWTGDPNRAAGIVINAGLAAATVPIVWWITRRLFDARAAQRVLPLATLLPGFVVWPSQLLRDAAVFFLLAVIAASILALTRRVHFGAVIGASLATVTLFTFRGPVAMLMAAGSILALVLAGRGFATRLAGGGGAAGAVLALVLVLGIGGSGLRFARSLDLEQLNGIRLDSSRSAATGFAPDADISTADRALYYLPLGLTHFLVGPWPWEVQGIRQLPALIDAAAWWLLLPALCRGLRRCRSARTTTAAVLLVPALLLSAGLALGVANFGTTVRQRTQVLVLLVPIVAAGWSKDSPVRISTPRRAVPLGSGG